MQRCLHLMGCRAKLRLGHRSMVTLIIISFLVPAISAGQEAESKSDAKQEPAASKAKQDPLKEAPEKSPKFYSPLRKKQKPAEKQADKNEAAKPDSTPAETKQVVQPDKPKLDKGLPVELMDKGQPMGVVRPEDKVPAKDGAAPAEEQDVNDEQLQKFFLPDSPEAEEALNALPRAARVQLENNLLPALQSGNFPRFIDAMETLVGRQEPETVIAVDNFCQSAGIGTLKGHVTEIFVRSIEQGLSIQRKGMPPAFVEYVVSGVMEAVDLELQEVDDHALMQDPLTLPLDWRDAEQLFWEVHVWRNRFINLNQMVSVADMLQQPMRARAARGKDEATTERLLKSVEMVQRVRSKYKELCEREAELRILELAKAEEVLRLKPDFESQLNAAFVLEMHAGALDEFFRENPADKLERESLREPNVITECTELVASGREHGKDVIAKAVLLRVGAHWWLRGRYGVGTMANGLLKPPGAMKSQDLMFGLFMPKKRPQAIGYVDDETGSESSGYDRRHYYTWAVERRDVGVNRSSRFGPAETTEKVTGSDASHFY